MQLGLGLGFTRAYAGGSTLSISTEPEGTISITATGPGSITVTVSGTTIYDGSYTFDPALLATGPVNLVAPAISGTATVGQTLTSTPGLWVYSGTEPTITNAWYRDAAAISGETGTSYTVISADEGTDLTLRETATQSGIGARSADSNAIAIPAAGMTDPTDLGAKLIAWFDLTDAGTLYTDYSGATPSTANGDQIRYIADKSGNSHNLTTTNVGGGYGLRETSSLDWNEAAFRPSSSWSGLTTGMELFAVINPNTSTQWLMAGVDGDNSYGSGLADPTATTAVDAGSGWTTGITHSIDGVDLVSPNRKTIYDAVKGSAGFKVQSLRGINLTGRGTTFRPMGYPVVTLSLDGSIRHFVVTTTLTTQERSDLIAWLLAEAA